MKLLYYNGYNPFSTINVTQRFNRVDFRISRKRIEIYEKLEYNLIYKRSDGQFMTICHKGNIIQKIRIMKEFYNR